MVKRIYLIRHAQAEHNVKEEYHIPDAKLTSLGETQAAQLQRHYPRLSDHSTRPQVIFTSPLTRTIQTSKLGFEDKASSCEIIPVPELQENSAMPCDTGSKLEIIRQRFPELDFSGVPADWNTKRGQWEDSQSALSKRAQKLRNMLATRSEERIALVTHGGFCSVCQFWCYHWSYWFVLVSDWHVYPVQQCRVSRIPLDKRWRRVMEVFACHSWRRTHFGGSCRGWSHTWETRENICRNRNAYQNISDRRSTTTS